MAKLILIALIICVTQIFGTNAECFINMNKDLTFQHPLLLKLNSSEFIYPNTKNGIKFQAGDKIHLVCSGGSNHFTVKTNLKEAIATCVSNQTFSVDNNVGSKLFKQLDCTQYPEPVAKRTGSKCSRNATEIKIGFETKSGFVPIMLNCFDEVQKDTLYSSYILSSQIKNQQYSVPRPNDFLPGDFYNDLSPKPSKVYERRSQRTAFERILGSEDLAADYISLNTDFFLSRGHFTAKADFVYGSQQRATFFYVNVAPQWHTLNSNNWNELEMSVRNYAGKNRVDLIVYTGVYGNSQLPDINNNLKNLSIYVNKNKYAIKVPGVFWKILFNPNAGTGTVFLSHNNPYEGNVKPLCSDVSGKISWLTWMAHNVTAGYSYACNYDEFAKLADYLPKLPIEDLLV